MLVILEITKYFSIYHNYGGSFRILKKNVMNFFFYWKFSHYVDKENQIGWRFFLGKKNENVAIWRQWVPIGYKD